MSRRICWVVGALVVSTFTLACSAREPGETEAPATDRPNFVFVLIDDQRYDALGALNPFFETPHLDALMARGVLFENAFVTTSLCSPSRASILTGQYAHKHQVLANRTPLDPQIPTFGQELEGAGYDTGFFGKWHMGGADDSPRPGWGRWVSFPAQGVYYDPRFNVDGERVQREGYTTDLITDYAVEFLESRSDVPFLAYVSHKAVHSNFDPAERHRGSYAGRAYPYPESMANTEANYRGKPDWVRAQRNSWHGVDGMYDGDVEMDQFVLDYAETLLAVDESVGRLVAALEEQGLMESTYFVFTSDNGFQFGEHGLIDKRTMYEASIRVPLLVAGPGIEPGSRRPEMILNVDYAPTFLELAGAAIPDGVQGRSFAPLLRGEDSSWRTEFLYEYFWERAFPQTPTVLGVRTDTHKLMRYHGVWDRYELYDLVVDPDERNNLVGDFVTTTEIGHVEVRVLGAPNEALEPLLGTGAEDPELKELFRDLTSRLDAQLAELGAASEPNWRPE
ncbi:MAG: sulfatase [Acidobacteriota bacterium]